MAKKSFIKRMFSLGRTEDEFEDQESLDLGSDFETGASGEAALRPSITEILFKRRTEVPEQEERIEAAPTEESTSEDTLVPERTADRKVSRKEETAQKLSEGLESMTGLLKSINDTLESGNERNRILADSIDELPEVLRSIPETNRAQIEFLGTISKQLDLQTTRSGEFVENFRDLPAILKSIPESQREQAGKLSEIVSLLSDNSTAQIDQLKGMQRSQHATLAAFQNTQNKSLNLFHKAQQQSLAAFKGSQASQSEQIQGFIEQTQRTMNRMILAGAAILGASLAAVGAVIYFLK